MRDIMLNFIVPASAIWVILCALALVIWLARSYKLVWLGVPPILGLLAMWIAILVQH